MNILHVVIINLSIKIRIKDLNFTVKILIKNKTTRKLGNKRTGKL